MLAAMPPWAEGLARHETDIAATWGREQVRSGLRAKPQQPAPLAGLAHDHRQKPDTRPAPDAAGAVGWSAFYCGRSGAVRQGTGDRRTGRRADCELAAPHSKHLAKAVILN